MDERETSASNSASAVRKIHTERERKPQQCSRRTRALLGGDLPCLQCQDCHKCLLYIKTLFLVETVRTFFVIQAVILLGCDCTSLLARASTSLAVILHNIGCI